MASLTSMETPEHERRWVEEYLHSQSGEEFAIEHVEKLTSEYVMGREYDVWDAHTNEGRWWVITNPMNLYSQEAIKSMDVALSFHVGLMMRVLASQPSRRSEGPESWILDVLRRLDVASSSLDRAKEVEDYQAVGMRLREALVSLGERLAELGVADGKADELPKRADFKAWAALGATALAPGQGGEELRGLLKATSERTWSLVNRLTHARQATELDGRLALSATTHVVDAFITATTRSRIGDQRRCPACGSYQLAVDSSDAGWIRMCETCRWDEMVDDVSTATTRAAADEEPAPPHKGECVVLEDFGIYLTPGQARAMIEQVADRMAAEGKGWSSPFATVDSDGSVIDAHRLALELTRGPASPGVELVYGCGDDACVNPGHAVEDPLPVISDWMLGIVERVKVHPDHLELTITTPDRSAYDVFVDLVLLDRLGYADASALSDRLVLLSPPDDCGWSRLVPATRRIDHGGSTVSNAWVRTAKELRAEEACPCGSMRPYDACHGRRFG